MNALILLFLVQCIIFLIMGVTLVMYTQTYVKYRVGEVAHDVDQVLKNYSANPGQAMQITSTPTSNKLTVNTGSANGQMLIGQTSFQYDAMAKNMVMSNGQSSISMSDTGKVRIMPSLSIGDSYKIVPNATGLQICDASSSVCKQILTA